MEFDGVQYSILRVKFHTNGFIDVNILYLGKLWRYNNYWDLVGSCLQACPLGSNCNYILLTYIIVQLLIIK
jgi:hypothetical protein